MTKKKSTPLDILFGEPVTTTMLLNPRAGELEQLREIVATDIPDKQAILDDLRERIIKALKSIDALAPDGGGTYDAFMLGAHMKHVFAKQGGNFPEMNERTLGIGAEYFFQGFTGKPFRVIPKSEILQVPELSEPVVIVSQKLVESAPKKPTKVQPGQLRFRKALDTRRIETISPKQIRRAQSRDEKRLFDAITA